jgi:ribonuclease J
VESVVLRRLFYSGDLRAHGRKPGAFHRMLADPPRDVDVLLLEGTRVRPDGEDDRCSLTEHELELALVERFQATARLALVLASAQNLDRLVTAYRAARRARRKLVVDLYTATVARATGRETIPQVGTHDLRIYVPNRQRLLVMRSQEFERTRLVARRRVFLDELRERGASFALLIQPSTLPELGRAACLEDASAAWSISTRHSTASGTARRRPRRHQRQSGWRTSGPPTNAASPTGTPRSTSRTRRK